MRVKKKVKRNKWRWAGTEKETIKERKKAMLGV